MILKNNMKIIARCECKEEVNWDVLIVGVVLVVLGGLAVIW